MPQPRVLLSRVLSGSPLPAGYCLHGRSVTRIKN